jgi:methyl-accepting chemotaxis protein
MSNQREPGRRPPRSGRTSGLPVPSERKLALSGLVHRALVSFNERDQQRARLINVLILAQALLTLSAAPGYLGTRPDPVTVLAAALPLVVCLVAWTLNRFFQHARNASYVLVFGGAGAVVLQVALAAVSGSALEASQTSLLLLAVILEAGLLFSPEVTLIVAATAAVLTAAALLLAVSLGASGSRREAYLLVVDVLGLQAVSGLFAWLLAQFIYESVGEAQRAQEQQFAQARLEALLVQSGELHRRLDAAVRVIQEAIGHALGGDLTARAAVLEGELSPVAQSMNLLLERLAMLAQGDVMRQRMESAALPLIDVVGRVAEGGATPASLPVMTNTTIDSVSVAVGQMQANVARRLTRVQELAGEIVGALAHVQNGMSATAQTASEALRTVGASIAAADGMLTTSQREVELIARARRSLGDVLPDEITGSRQTDGRMRDPSSLDPAEAAALLGLGVDLGVGGPGLTGAFGLADLREAGGAANQSLAESAAPAPSLSVSLPEGDPQATGPAQAGEQDSAESSPPPSSASKRRRGARAAAAATTPPEGGEPPVQLVEIWQLLNQLHDEAVRQERAATTLTHELGLVNRNVRGVDTGVAWARQALEAGRRNAEKLHQTAGGSAPLPVPGDSGPGASPPLADMPGRRPTATRPLADSNRLSSGALLGSMGIAPAPAGEPHAAVGPGAPRANGSASGTAADASADESGSAGAAAIPDLTGQGRGDEQGAGPLAEQ